MALGEYGIIFHDLFIDKDLFINAFIDYYREKSLSINEVSISLLNLLSNYNVKTVSSAMAAQFQSLWKQFQIEVLGNKNPLQLLVVYRDDQLGKKSQFSQIIDQNKVEEVVATKYGKRYGINAGNELIKDSFKIIQARKVEGFLQQHLQGLMTQLNQTIDRSTAEALHDYHSHLLSDIYTTSDKQKRQHITGQTWQKIIYGNAGKGQWQGNAYEAFFNHMADHEPAIFDYLSTKGDEELALFNYTVQKNSVFIEEGGNTATLGNFPNLMMGQINSIPWFAGGDLVIINNKREVIYNIQLKTTTWWSQSVFSEKVNQLKNFLIKFTSAETDIEKANLLFESFKNTAANSSLANALGNEVKETIEDGLLKRIQESLQSSIS